jgi:hypothetical protein
MSFSRRIDMKRRRISDYSKKRAPVSNNDHEETRDPKEIFLPSTMASPLVARKKNRKVKSLNFQRENSGTCLGLRSTLGREKRVTRGLGFGFHRESSVSRGHTFRNRTEAREEEEIQFDFPKRPLTKRQRKRDGDSDDGAPSRSNYPLKIAASILFRQAFVLNVKACWQM